MGSLASISKQEKFERKKLNELLNFDLDFGLTPEMRFVDRFARENSNDRGEKLHPQTANLIAREFLLFLWGTWKLLRDNGDLTQNQPLQEDPKKIVIVAKAPCCLMLGRLWDLLLCYSMFYRDLCS